MSVDIKKKVAERLVELAPSVAGVVVETLAQKENGRRIEAFLDVVDKLDNATKELRKIKPDNVQYDANDIEISASYSKELVEKRKKLKDQIAKFEKAIEATEAEPRDFTKLFEISGK
jgi:SMC interacting uncharacterized protein involved in chromosome segregation